MHANHLLAGLILVQFDVLLFILLVSTFQLDGVVFLNIVYDLLVFKYVVQLCSVRQVLVLVSNFVIEHANQVIQHESLHSLWSSDVDLQGLVLGVNTVGRCTYILLQMVFLFFFIVLELLFQLLILVIHIFFPYFSSVSQYSCHLMEVGQVI